MSWFRPLAVLVFSLAMLAAPRGFASPPSTNPAALARLEARDSLLVYVDYVTGLDNLINTIPPRQFRNNVEAFAKLNALFKMPAVVLGEENDFYGTFLPEITRNVTHDFHRFPRTTVSGYTPDMAAWLKSQGRRNVIIGGITIDNCTLETALDLLRAGYNVYVVVDASGSNSKLAEEMAIHRLRDAGAVTVTWLNVTTELARDFKTPEGAAAMELIRQHWPASTVGPVQDLTPDGHGWLLPEGAR
jgi:hypothetical protein